jgi:hypothetical protein
MNPVTILAWAELTVRVAGLAGKLADMGYRMTSGQDVTPEELSDLKDETNAAVARWNAAAPNDKET